MEVYYLSQKTRAVLSGALLTAASTGVFANGSAVFMVSVCADLGIERAAFALINSVSLIFSMTALPFFGKMLSTVNIKLLTVVCSLVCASVPLGYSFCRVIWQFYLLSAINGVFVNGITLITVATLLERLKIKAKGSLLGASFAGAGAVSFVILPLIQKTVQNFGWRWGYRIQSMAGAVLLILAVTVMKNTRPAIARQNKNTLQHFKKITSDRRFRFASVGLFLANSANLALFGHTAANLSDIGFPPSMAAQMISLTALFSSVSKPVYGLMLDKFGLKFGAVFLGTAVSLTGWTALLLGRTGFALWIYPLLLSFCACANSIPANAFASRLFGGESFTAAASLLTFASTAGSAVGTPAAGLVFDRMSSYTAVWCGCISAGAISAAMLFLASLSQKSK